MAVKICIKCQEKILPEQRGVLLRTFEGKKVIEDVYFHLSCFKLWHDQKATEKSEKQMKVLIGNSLKFAKQMQDEGKIC
jgi:hypothetical protein